MSNTATRPFPPQSTYSPAWQELYAAALFETNREKLSPRIAEAEKAIAARSRELFSAGSDMIEEEQALDDALYGLKALQSCVEVNNRVA